MLFLSDILPFSGEVLVLNHVVNKGPFLRTGKRVSE